MYRLALCYLTKLNDKNYQLKRTLPVFIGVEDNLFWAFNEELEIYICDRTIEGALQKFEETLLSDYEIYAKADPSSLSKGAQELAKKLQELIEEVPVQIAGSINDSKFFHWRGRTNVCLSCG